MSVIVISGPQGSGKSAIAKFFESPTTQIVDGVSLGQFYKEDFDKIRKCRELNSTKDLIFVTNEEDLAKRMSLITNVEITEIKIVSHKTK